MESSHSSDTTSAVVILNASHDLNLREVRSKILNQAGYYTSSANSAEETIDLARRLHCAIAIVCYSFSYAERGKIYERIRATAPATRVILLSDFADGDPNVLIDTVKKALKPKA